MANEQNRVGARWSRLVWLRIEAGTALLCRVFFWIWFFLGWQFPSYAVDPVEAAAGLERRYSSVKTVAGNFRQTYLAPGIEQTESGIFWLKRPALMRWEYQDPEEKLFIADGRAAYLYVPGDRQVTVQPYRASDFRNMPLELLLGAGNIHEDYLVTQESEFKGKTEGSILIRLTPRRSHPQYAFTVIELDRATYDVRRIVIREQTGNLSEFVFSQVKTNIAIASNKFQFKIPKGVEIIRLTQE